MDYREWSDKNAEKWRKYADIIDWRTPVENPVLASGDSLLRIEAALARAARHRHEWGREWRGWLDYFYTCKTCGMRREDHIEPINERKVLEEHWFENRD